MKRCPNNHDNPDKAKFCRICGYKFNNRSSPIIKVRPCSIERSSLFTPDMFPNINLIPYSVAKVDFQCKKGRVFMAVLIVLFIALNSYQYEIEELMYYTWGWPSDLSYYIVPSISGILIILFLIKFIPFLVRTWRWLRYKMNADYIEYSEFMPNLCRIAKKGKLGLFDKSKNIVAMRSRYDNITRFDVGHILVVKNGKKGLFSIKKMGLIVPIRFDRIDAFKNSIVKCHKGAESYYYDVNGNKME